MGFLVLLSFFIHPVVLLFLLWLVARKNASFEFANVFFVCLAITFGSVFFVARFYESHGAVTLLPVAAGSVFLMMRFLYTNLVQAIVILVLFGLWQVAYNSAVLKMIM